MRSALMCSLTSMRAMPAAGRALPPRRPLAVGEPRRPPQDAGAEPGVSKPSTGVAHPGGAPGSCRPWARPTSSWGLRASHETGCRDRVGGTKHKRRGRNRVLRLAIAALGRGSPATGTESLSRPGTGCRDRVQGT